MSKVESPDYVDNQEEWEQYAHQIPLSSGRLPTDFEIRVYEALKSLKHKLRTLRGTSDEQSTPQMVDKWD